MERVGRGLAVIGLGCILSAASVAAPIVVSGTINRTGGNAVGNSIFDGFTTTTVDYIPFSIDAGINTVTIDVRSVELSSTTLREVDINGDGLIAYLDPTIYLFRANGVLDLSDYTFQTSEFSFNTFGDGSVSFLDPYLELANVLTPGNYLVAIGSDDLTLDAAIAGSYTQSIGPIGADDTVAPFGAYQVTITTVPEPASAVLLGAGVMAMLGLRRRTRQPA